MTKKLLPFRLLWGRALSFLTIFAYLLPVSRSPQAIVPPGPLQSVSNTATLDGGEIFMPLVRGGSVTVPGQPAPGQQGEGWPTAGANPQRTSWTAEEVRGNLKAVWYKQFEPYIPAKVQIIASNGMLFISTARGLYALDAATGAEKWIYPTELPLGHSPTISKGVAYVGGFDKKLHAVEAATGRGLWTFQAGAGFDTNPLVADGKVLIGNRDGVFYAVHAEGPNAGQLAWKYTTGGPIHYSAAYGNGVVYFASDDSYGYALNAATGELVWKSGKLPGAGFQSWWPVVYGEWVIFSGSLNYRNSIEPGPASRINTMERDDLFPNFATDPKGTLVGPLGTEAGNWAAGTPTIDLSKPTVTANGSTNPVTEYFETKPWRRAYLVLNGATGQEYTTDFDRDGKPEYAPILWLGTKSGNRFPPVVGSDGVIYQSNDYMSSEGITGGHISGWKIGTPFISVPSADWNAVDEPHAYAAGGDLIYWNLCCNRTAGAFDVTIPNQGFINRYNNGVRPPTGNYDVNREWLYFSYYLQDDIPGVDSRYYNGTTRSAYSAFGGRNGVYGVHGNQNPPIPYAGKVYMHRTNAVIAFAQPTGAAPAALPMAKTVQVNDPAIPVPSATDIRSRLANEVQKMIQAGHLRPGYTSAGIWDFRASRWCGDELQDYWSKPGETLVTLIRALPHLPVDLQAQAKAYLQAEFSAYPPYQVTHTGWKTGAPREPFLLPGDVEPDLTHFPVQTSVSGFAGWKYPPQAFYAMWKYAQTFGGAKAMFDAAKVRLDPAPADPYLQEFPNIHNGFIAGYWGYLELEKLAGYPESAATRQELNRLLSLRASTFSKDAPDSFFNENNAEPYYCRALNVSRNFIDLTPELAQYLRANALDKVQAALSEYQEIAPYWFVSKFDTAFAEGAYHHLYDSPALFQAKAWILQEPQGALVKYLDVPATAVGDLFFIQNLVAALEAANSAADNASTGLACLSG